MPLAQAMAISSGFLASWGHNKNEILKGICSTEKLLTWGVLEGKKGGRCLTCWRVPGFNCWDSHG